MAELSGDQLQIRHLLAKPGGQDGLLKGMLKILVYKNKYTQSNKTYILLNPKCHIQPTKDPRCPQNQTRPICLCPSWVLVKK